MDFNFSDSVTIIVALLVSVIAPLMLSVLTGKQAHRAKIQDWARQDQVAAQAEKAAALLLEKQNQQAAKAEEAAVLLLDKQNQIAGHAAEAATLLATKQDEIAKQAEVAATLLLEAQNETKRRTDEVASRVAQSDRDIKGQLQEIHKLVNSSLTEAREAELDSMVVSLGLLRRVIEMDRDHGLPVNNADAGSLEAKRARIEQLQTIVADRHAQEAVAAVAPTAKPPSRTRLSK